MLHPIILIGLALALAVAVVVALRLDGGLIASRAGRLALLLGAGIIPVAMSGANLREGMEESSRTRFCLGCHEMGAYGKSLFVDEPRALPAMHYQKRLISRDSTCFSCHTDYAMFGDLKAKMNGLRHVWAHYVAGVPNKIALYKSYPNYNCLHCHDDARSFVDAAAHKPLLTELQSGRTSCLTCHNVGHALGDDHKFWLAP
jgi:cytochrome c-type protein NapC